MAVLTNILNSYEKGVLAENQASNLLQEKGYEILKKRFKTVYGEIDIIAKKDNEISFIEVKKRKKYAHVMYSISEKNKKRIINTAEIFLSQNAQYFSYIKSFNAFLFFNGKLLYIKNAW